VPMAFLDGLKDFGFEKTRRALALLALSFFITMYGLSLVMVPPEMRPMFVGLMGCYLTAFVALASEWFWARWFASGLGWSGVLLSLMFTVLHGWLPFMGLYGGLHAVVVVALLGDKMSALYDMQEGWRGRYGMDEYGVARLRKMVTRSAASLPTLIVMALGPREIQGNVLVIGGVLGIAGVIGGLRLRTWGLFAMGAASIVLARSGPAPAWYETLAEGFTYSWSPPYASSLAAVLLAFAVLPFARPAIGFLLRRP